MTREIDIFKLNEFDQHMKMAGKSDATRSAYRGDVLAMIRICGLSSPDEIDYEALKEWDFNLSSTKHPNTRARCRIGVKQYLEFLSTEYKYPPLHDELSFLGTYLSDPYLLHPEELEAILHSQDPEDPIQARDGALIALLTSTGIRVSEAARLRMGDIRLAGDSLGFVLYVHSAKTAGHSKIRVINFGDISKKTDIAKCHFGFWFAKRLMNYGGRRSTKAQSMPVFASLRTPFEPMVRSALWESVARACARTRKRDGTRLDLSKVSPHTFRHFFATQCRIKGMPLEIICAYLGHSSIQQTERYIHLAEKMTAHAMRKHNPTADLHARGDLVIGTTTEEKTYFEVMLLPPAS